MQAWWEALAEYPLESLSLLLSGGFFVLLFHVNITWLAGITSAVAIGIVGELKVVPQWLLNAFFSFEVDLSPLNLLGAALSLLGSILYVIAASLPRKLKVSHHGFEWCIRASVKEQLLATTSSVR
eukprot:CAMPEP_0169170620 /NCGR_PEP_ID=MMETSP1015-20121227/62260_1 /TAXON_ID=342587 /ORGANISM="Karlodinium micrum, Strain CCMP2283" /LENGTH=124 /DNA_ID=CAMNT_0009243725 /DNA_START=21 /DNA_END=395 /DNA_ORIENTATION=+